ncbi:hypothetical protein ES706_01793 [subsurface metagenome]
MKLNTKKKTKVKRKKIEIVPTDVIANVIARAKPVAISSIIMRLLQDFVLRNDTACRIASLVRNEAVSQLDFLFGSRNLQVAFSTEKLRRLKCGYPKQGYDTV